MRNVIGPQTYREPGSCIRRSHRCSGTVSPGTRRSCTPSHRRTWRSGCGCSRPCSATPCSARRSPCSSPVGHRRCATARTAADSRWTRSPGSQSSRPPDSERIPRSFVGPRRVCWALGAVVSVVPGNVPAQMEDGGMVVSGINIVLIDRRNVECVCVWN